jgi:hypothetical protein
MKKTLLFLNIIFLSLNLVGGSKRKPKNNNTLKQDSPIKGFPLSQFIIDAYRKRRGKDLNKIKELAEKNYKNANIKNKKNNF